MNRSSRSSLAAALTGVALCAAACGPSTTEAVLPFAAEPSPEPEATLIWLGRGEADSFVDGAWRRTEEHDYELSVVQRRYRGRWDSIKELHRRHPAYDGSAGPRDETFHFELRYGPAAGDSLPFEVTSTLGDGRGTTDPEFRRATLELDADVSSFAPFDTYRLTQRYDYEQGLLIETVDLLDAGDGVERPFVRIRERAELFAPTKYDSPPTVARR